MEVTAVINIKMYPSMMPLVLKNGDTQLNYSKLLRIDLRQCFQTPDAFILERNKSISTQVIQIFSIPDVCTYLTVIFKLDMILLRFYYLTTFTESSVL